MHYGASTPSRIEALPPSEWQLLEKNLKTYPHFDPILSAEEAEALAKDRHRVSKHTFYPFLRFKQRWTKYVKRGGTGKVKERPIRYASRADAYIFARYRHILAEKYELELARRGLSEVVLAYRRVLRTDGKGKCNIDHASDAINRIRSHRNCYAITLDISSFFESLDHVFLKSLWCRMLGEARLPDDHFQVFKAITAYAVVDKEAVYERLGHYGEKRTSSGKAVKGFLTPHKAIPKHLCTGKVFREKIAGGDGRGSLIRKNLKPYGIPQGAPISDLLANLYLLDFDDCATAIVKGLGGTYMRYSDDILIILPCDEDTAFKTEKQIRTLINGFGKKLKIKEEKSSICHFKQLGNDQEFKRVFPKLGSNGLEYLGFRYDGRFVYLRDSTLSNLRRKMVRRARAAAIRHVIRYSDKDAATLKAMFNHDDLATKFRRVENFYEKVGDPREWTFWTYAKRASETFGGLGRPILRQLRGHRRLLEKWANEEIELAVKRRSTKP
jgi:hypothetical protein